MAIHRGIQSAIFYYLSCAPCAESGVRKKRKRDAVRGRADREALYVEMPNVYRHPSPSSTNPHWAAEIAAGPVHVGRAKRKNAGNRERNRELKTSMTQRSEDSAAPSSIDLRWAESADGRSDSKMQIQRCQQEGDEPWGSTASFSTGRLESRGSGVTKPPRAHLDDAYSYKKAKAPMVNDLHPATITKVHSREEARWMMEAPPTADVMGGKDRAARSRSDSGGSSRLSARGVPLSREVSQRIMAQKLRSGETLPLPSPGLSRASTAISDHQPTGQRHDRLTEQIDFAFPYDSPKKRKPSPIRIQVSEDSSDSAVTVLRDTAQAVQKPEARRVASRPQLSTIKSDSLLPSDTEEDFSTPAETPKENSLPYLRHSDDGSSSEARDRISRRSPLLLQGDSVHGLDGFAPPKAAMSSQDLRKDFRRELYEDFPQFRTARHGSQDSMEEAGGAELFDSWYTPDFELPEWILEHTKREVKQRWSMDI